MDKKIEKSLANFGLSEPEINIYTSILKLDKPTVTEISRKTGLQRTVIYFHLKDLIEQNIVHEIKKGKIKRFSPTPPQELAERFQRWTTDFTSLVPELEALHHIDEEAPIVTIHDFKTSHYDHYNELASMPVGSEFRVIQSKKSADLDFESLKNEAWGDILERLVERKIMTRAIFDDGMVDTAREHMDPETYNVFKQRLWQIRTVKPEKFDFEEMFIHQDKVTFLLTDIGLLMRIQHKRIAHALTSMFDALWLTGKPRKFE